MQTEIQLSSRRSNQDRVSPFPVSTATLEVQLSLVNKMGGGMDSHSVDVSESIPAFSSRLTPVETNIQ